MLDLLPRQVSENLEGLSCYICLPNSFQAETTANSGMSASVVSDNINSIIWLRNDYTHFFEMTTFGKCMLAAPRKLLHFSVAFRGLLWSIYLEQLQSI